MQGLIAFIRQYNRKRLQKRHERRRARRVQSAAPSVDIGVGKDNVFDAFRQFHGRGPEFEEALTRMPAGNPVARLVAFYLPQFHAIPENDRWWGKGFTEWRNVTRAVPRFRGHYQPRAPLDLGFYDLADPNTLVRQVELARAAGIEAFCFHYYSFDGKRVLDAPIEAFLERSDIHFKFCLNWANENWTRRWDGFDDDVLMRQTYSRASEWTLVEDICRHFKDPRYLRIDGRPLFLVYRPGIIPDFKTFLSRFRQICFEMFGERPFVMMAQGFGDTDPEPFGLDAAVEFPPHKLAVDLKPEANLEIFDPHFAGFYFNYDDLVAKSEAEPVPSFELVRAVAPGWDNEARKQGKGMGFIGASPRKYERWLSTMIHYAQQRPLCGRHPFVFINAWNEWAEGAYLEPDVHYGHAFLNATRRAAYGLVAPLSGRNVVLFGHDAHRHGAQLLLLGIAKALRNHCGVNVAIVLTGDGDLLPQYEKVAKTAVLQRADQLSEVLASFGPEFTSPEKVGAITNTVVVGWLVPLLSRLGIRTISLVHELDNFIIERRLQASADDVARKAHAVVFSSQVVEAGFNRVCIQPPAHSVILPQGIYQNLGNVATRRDEICRALSIPASAKLIVNVGYADLRKGFDLFVELAKQRHIFGDDTYFAWIGNRDDNLAHWLLADPALSGPDSRVRLVDFTDSALDYVAAANAFALTSREDPFPSVVLESLALGVPVVAFADAGGCVDVVGVPGNGSLVRKCDVPAMARALADVIASDSQEARARRAQQTRDTYGMRNYVFSLLLTLHPSLKRVSVVITNYNHGRYLSQRITSVLAQSYPLYEVIFYDDGSTDDSVAIAKQIAEEAGRSITIRVASRNSGSPFGNWLAALQMCQGEFVWFAEADDAADPSFVEQLVRASDERTTIAFCDSQQIDGEGRHLADSYRYYLDTFDPDFFGRGSATSGPKFVRDLLMTRNCILSVSGVIFRVEQLRALLMRSEADIRSHRLAGDWRIYVDLLADPDSEIVYLPSALNIHRRHERGVTESMPINEHLEEIERVQAHIAAVYEIGEADVETQISYRVDLRTRLEESHAK